jgi:hypothetical protein
MTWRKSIHPIQPSTVEGPQVAAGQIDGLVEALLISFHETVSSNLVCRAEADTERFGVLLAGAAAALRQLLEFSAATGFSLTCQGSRANLLLRSISLDRLVYLVFQPVFPLSLAAYHAAHLADAAYHGGLRKSSASI